MTDRRAAIAIFVVALVLRVIPALVLPAERVTYPDTTHYQEIARHIVAGDGYVDDLGERANRLPGYTLFLAAHRVLFGSSILPIQLTQALLGALTCLVLWRLAGPIFGPRAGMAAAGVLAIYPLLAVTCALLLIETPLAFCLVLQLALLRSAATAGRPFTAAAAGLAGGAAMMMQAGFALLFLFLLPLAWWAARGRRPAAVVLAFVAGTMILPGVWTARNYRALGEIVPFSTRSGMTFHDSFQFGYLEGEQWQFEPDRGSMAEMEFENRFRRKGIELAWHQPGRTLRLAVMKQKYFWNVIPNHPGYRNWQVALLTIPFLPVLLLFLAGLVVLPRSRPEALWLLIPILYTASVHMVYTGSIRYRIPIEPFLIAVAVGTGWELARAWRQRRAPAEARAVSPG